MYNDHEQDQHHRRRRINKDLRIECLDNHVVCFSIVMPFVTQ
ncbi:hypothetical protein SynBIOSU31_02044 [Synechococcus sp. BIOS-U3-1]|nr:hypothetical protein SynBIOSU31_02044 [Synechococcus sp. BIOS-U3-1]